MEVTILTPASLNQLVEQSGLEVVKQKNVADILQVFFNKATEYQGIIDTLVITDPSQVGKMKMAKEGRLELKRMRLEADKLVQTKRDNVKQQMSDFILEDKLWLKAGQMINLTFKHMEANLEEKETFAERWEAIEKAKLKEKRMLELQPYMVSSPYLAAIDPGEMSDEVYSKLLADAKVQLEAKEAADKEAARVKAENEAKLKEKQKKEAEEKEKIKKENERLKKQAEEAKKIAQEAEERRQAEIKKYQEEQQKTLREAKEKEDKIKAEIVKERKAARVKQLHLEKQMEDEKLKNETLFKELEAKKKAEQEELEKEYFLAEERKKMSDKDLLLHFATHLDILASEPPDLKTPEFIRIMEGTKGLLGKTATYIRQQIEKLENK